MKSPAMKPIATDSFARPVPAFRVCAVLAVLALLPLGPWGDGGTLRAGHPAADAEGFETIYDGSEEIGLSKLETEGNWVPQEDGVLYLTPREGESGWKRYRDYLWLEGVYGDFVLDFEYKYEEDGNSGVFFRVGDRDEPVEDGWEVQIKDSTGLADEAMGHHDNGGIIRTKGADRNMTLPAGEWNRITVSMQGERLVVVLNGETVQDFDLAAAKPEGKVLHPEGSLGIQDHGENFWVRNIRVKR